MRARAADRLERRLVWMVGSPRTGTTWLASMLHEHLGAVTLDEPQIGTHLSLFSPDLLGVPAVGFPEANLLYADWRAGADDYFFSNRYADVWRPALRRLLLERFAAQAPGRAPVILKEPNGSQAAPLLGSLLPRSRLLVVWRDGRDVVDSQLDAGRKGAWLDVVGGGQDLEGRQRLDYLGERAVRWVARIRAVRQAYAQHDPVLRLAVTYEQLLAEPEAGLRQIAGWLGAPAVRPVQEVVDAFAFDALDASRRGAGRFARAATPGLWRTSFSRTEQELLNELMGEQLAALGYQV